MKYKGGIFGDGVAIQSDAASTVYPDAPRLVSN
jgi:hypothetical protein